MLFIAWLVANIGYIWFFGSRDTYDTYDPIASGLGIIGGLVLLNLTFLGFWIWG